MAMYPETTFFYPAEVLAIPSDVHPAESVSPLHSSLNLKWTAQAVQSKPLYRLKFEDDDDQEHFVSAEFVVEWPGQLDT